MASLYITEFQASGNSESGAQLQVGMQPAVAMQKLSSTSAWADAAGTVPYSGGALRRIDALF